MLCKNESAGPRVRGEIGRDRFRVDSKRETIKVGIKINCTFVFHIESCALVYLLSPLYFVYRH